MMKAAPFEVSEYTPAVEQLVKDLFQQILFVDVDETRGSGSVDSNDLISAAVFFQGEWEGAVILECNGAQACLMTQRFTDMPTPTEVNEDALDAMGEFANTIGGNLKSIMPRGVKLSVPKVIRGEMTELKSSGQSHRLEINTELGPVAVTFVVG